MTALVLHSEDKREEGSCPKLERLSLEDMLPTSSYEY